MIKLFEEKFNYFSNIYFKGDPLHIGMDLTIASFDSISEVNMVSGNNFFDRWSLYWIYI